MAVNMWKLHDTVFFAAVNQSVFTKRIQIREQNRTPPHPTYKMPANQNHGFLWEDEIKTKVFQCTAQTGYTDTHDIDKTHNRFNPRENISIKVTGSGTVCMGDALRVFSYSSEDVHTGIVLRYRQEEDSKVLCGVYELDLDNRALLWGTLTAEDIQSLDTLVRSMPPGARDAALDRQIKERKRELNARSGVVRFNPKIDSGTQRRLQCSIPNFAAIDALIRTRSVDCVVRGVLIVASIASGRRIRNARV